MAWAICTSNKWSPKSSKLYASFMAMVLPPLNLYFRSIVVSFKSEAVPHFCLLILFYPPKGIQRLLVALPDTITASSQNECWEKFGLLFRNKQPSLTLISLCFTFDISSPFLKRRLITKFRSFSFWACCFCNPHLSHCYSNYNHHYYCGMFSLHK